MEIRARYVWVGLFTLAVILGGFAFVYWLQTAGSLGKRTNYEVHFSSSVSGLLKGSPVLFNGIRVGDVTSLRLMPEDPRQVAATISVEASTPVRTDTLVSLEFQGLTGVAVVTLSGGSGRASAPVPPPGGGYPLLTAAEGAGESMSEGARRVLARLDRILEENQADIRNIVSNISAFADMLGRNSGRVDNIVAGLERMTSGGKGNGAFYNLAALPAPASPAPLGKQISVADPAALMANDSEKLLSMNAAGQLEPLGNAKWSDTVPKLVQSRLVQSFENGGALGEVNRPNDGSTPEFQLVTEIRRFQLTQSPEPLGEVEISARLVGSDGHVAASRVFTGKEPAKSKEEAEAARALNTAFGSVEAAIVAWTRETLAAVPAAAPEVKSPEVKAPEVKAPEPALEPETPAAKDGEEGKRGKRRPRAHAQ